MSVCFGVEELAAYHVYLTCQIFRRGGGSVNIKAIAVLPFKCCYCKQLDYMTIYMKENIKKIWLNATFLNDGHLIGTLASIMSL